ncbi:hypothetical protein OG819_55385 [Streptomyces sp. NBC_01549]|uniref:hypothetical protein n=1 Tax=Streptomyces sp. NBC_01549 TaxID=2975874 RepID=UPI00225457F0|nr:hypothetical protein [Streptomyces sp. NBC_01549]MCX4598342.1 hypothetical protein [Streptomyces sp. NBC_01549]
MQNDFTPGGLRAKRDDVTTWSTADIEGFEYTLEAASPAYQEAVATGRFVLGRHAAGGEVVVEIGTAEDLARHNKAGTLHALTGGTSRSGKTSYAAVLEQLQGTAG